MPTWILSRPDRVGDVIIATSCLAEIRRQRPDVRLVFAAREAMRPLLEGHPLLEGFVGLGAAPRELAWQFSAVRAEAIVHFHPDRTAELAGWSAGIPRRIGRRRSLLLDWLTLTRRLPDRRREGRKHEAEYNFDVLALLGIPAPASAEALRPQVSLAEPYRTSMQEKLAAAGMLAGPEGYSVLNPTAFSPVLRWPPAAFAKLAVAAAGRLGPVVLTAERADDPAIQELRSRLGESAVEWIDLAGRLNLAELGWLLSGARVLISRNTGTAHLAAAVGCPVVELFGRAEPMYGSGRWRALGDRVRAIEGAPGARLRGESKKAYWRRGYEVIPVDEVLAAALELAGRSS